MRRVPLVIALLLALVALQGAAAAPADPTQFRNLTGQGSVTTTDGCIETLVGIFVVDSWDHQPPGAPTESVSASVEFVQQDTCAGTSVSAYGWTGDVTFSADYQLRFGEMTATFTSLQDSVSGVTLPPLTVVVTWEGTEDLTSYRSHDVYESDQGTTKEENFSSERVGTMTVNVTGDLNVQASGFGFLARTESRTVIVP